MNKKLLWLGCGEANHLPEKTQDYERSYFFEARQEALNNITEKFEGSVELVNAAVSVNGVLNNLEIYSIEELSSLKKPTGLKALFPGLVVEETREVEGISLSDCLSLCEVSGRDNTLIIDLPCIAGEIIESLIHTRNIELFSCIYVSSGIETLYEGAKTASELELLLNNGYFELNSSDTDDPDIPLFKYMYDERLANLGKARAQLEIAEEQAKELKRSVVELEAQLASKDSEIAQNYTRSKEYETELTAKAHSLEESNQKVEQLYSENNSLKNSLEVASNSLKDNREAFSALEKDLEKANLEAQKRISENEKLRFHLHESESNVDTLKIEVETLNSSINSLKAKLETSKNEIESLRSQLETSNSVIESLNVKLADSNSEIESLTLQLNTSGNKIEKLSTALKASVEEISQRNDSAEKDILKIKKLEDALKKSQDKCDEVYSWFASRKKQVEVLESQINSLKQERDNLMASRDTQKSVKELEAKIDALFKKQSNESVEIANALGRHITKSETNTRKELLALNKLQDVLHNKELITYGCGESLSSESLLFLTSLIRFNNYDVIIEFGSGTSTAVMADVVASKIIKNKTLHLGDDSKHSKEQNKLTEIKSGDFRSLPNYIISFEQSETFLGNTLNLLENANLTQFVDLCLSPLIDNKYSSGDSTLFYDCEEKLREVKRIFDERSANILVIVNGPLLKSNSTDVRGVALPSILDKLSLHAVDFFIEENNAELSQKLIASWRTETERRGLSYSFEQLSGSGESLLVKSRPL
ncbi:hypothetical protein KUC3_34120 [Alteromonas sp. KC3]|uniref:hypothetical protein n=1 Tax=unclassified Alteromonas TaxID=2614992 RepID=UPI001922CADE|nr:MULTISPECIES: hypothetical protein [unclassified Alteromonas]BCO20555.1 hypothetical protein KUC3_34120 [Alteromonas sp. KC3]BCO24524.1 hypothetical protein KUC14_33930 [Alteromonas sp. KC14]